MSLQFKFRYLYSRTCNVELMIVSIIFKLFLKIGSICDCLSYSIVNPGGPTSLWEPFNSCYLQGVPSGALSFKVSRFLLPVIIVSFRAWCFRTWSIFFFFFFLGPHPRHIEDPRLGVKSELRLPAYAIATAMRDLSHACDLHHSSWQCWILNPLDRTPVLMDTSWICFYWVMMGTQMEHS